MSATEKDECSVEVLPPEHTLPPITEVTPCGGVATGGLAAPNLEVLLPIAAASPPELLSPPIA